MTDAEIVSGTRFPAEAVAQATAKFRRRYHSTFIKMAAASWLPRPVPVLPIDDLPVLGSKRISIH